MNVHWALQRGTFYNGCEHTVQKMKFFIKDFFSKLDQIRMQ